MKSDPEAERIWTSCAQSIRSQVSDAVWRTTFSGARATAFDQRSLVLVVPTSLQKARIERRYFDLVSDAVDETTPDVTVRIEIDPDWAEAGPDSLFPIRPRLNRTPTPTLQRATQGPRPA